MARWLVFRWRISLSASIHFGVAPSGASVHLAFWRACLLTGSLSHPLAVDRL
jgi:hypothetical protein